MQMTTLIELARLGYAYLTYLLASVIVFLFGPGTYSVDGLLKKMFFSPQKGKITQSPVARMA